MRAGGLPVGRERLVALEDLLDDDPRAAARLAQPRAGSPPGRRGRPGGRSAARRCVPSASSDRTSAWVASNTSGSSTRTASERADVEEPPVVELLVGDPPVREPVVLALDQLGERQRLGARPDREDVVVVAQHGARALAGDLDLVQRELVAAEHGADAVAEHRHEHRAVARGPVDVEPVGVRGVRALGEHRPQRAVVPHRRRDGHVVGHDVEHQAEARRRARPSASRSQRRQAAERRGRSRRGRRRRTRASSPGAARRIGDRYTCVTPSDARYGTRAATSSSVRSAPSCTRYVETGTGRPAVGSRRAGVGRGFAHALGRGRWCGASACRRRSPCAALRLLGRLARRRRDRADARRRRDGSDRGPGEHDDRLLAQLEVVPASTVLPASICESVSTTAVQSSP